MAASSFAASRILVPSSSALAATASSRSREDACCAGFKSALAPKSFFFGPGIRICSGSSLDLPRKAASCRSMVVAEVVVVDGVVKTEAVESAKLEVSTDKKLPEEIPAPTVAKSFMADVASLVKLVDSKDIVELELKHKDYEIVIRKAEALEPVPSAAPPYPAFPSFPGYSPFPTGVAASPAPTPAAASPATPAESAPALPAAPQHPPMLSPMAGTFYRCPGPGEPPFVKVGDRVQKGQVLCIIEAMKLMNEIESDQAGTIVEIVAEDAKSVSADTPLFVIKP